MTGLRPLMRCLLALINTALWAALLHFTGLSVRLGLDRVQHILLLAAIFVLSLAILSSMRAGGANGDSSDPKGNGA